MSSTRLTKGKTDRRTLRWAFLEPLDIGAEGDPYLDRLRLVQTPLFGIYLHHIHRPDKDPHPHDHPWGFWSLILAGSYRERIWPGKENPGRSLVRNRARWSAARLGRDAAHLITGISGPLWTLVLVGPRRGEWGFWTPAGDGTSRFVPWREYTGQPEAGDPGPLRVCCPTRPGTSHTGTCENSVMNTGRWNP